MDKLKSGSGIAEDGPLPAGSKGDKVTAGDDSLRYTVSANTGDNENCGDTQTQTEYGKEDHGTVFLFAAPEVLELTDLDNPDMTFMASLKKPVIVGSGSDCDIRIGYDETVSRRHCCIYEKNSKIYVENLSSVNMTIACGEEAISPVMVYNNSELCLGRVRMQLEFH